MYTVYLLQSEKNNKSYVGVTEKRPEERLREHNSGSNQWTKGNIPFKLKYYESFICKEDAFKRENFLKTGVGNKLVKIILMYY